MLRNIIQGGKTIQFSNHRIKPSLVCIVWTCLCVWSRNVIWHLQAKLIHTIFNRKPSTENLATIVRWDMMIQWNDDMFLWRRTKQNDTERADVLRQRLYCTIGTRNWKYQDKWCTWKISWSVPRNIWDGVDMKVLPCFWSKLYTNVHRSIPKMDVHFKKNTYKFGIGW